MVIICWPPRISKLVLVYNLSVWCFFWQTLRKQYRSAHLFKSLAVCFFSVSLFPLVSLILFMPQKITHLQMYMYCQLFLHFLTKHSKMKMGFQTIGKINKVSQVNRYTWWIVQISRPNTIKLDPDVGWNC